MNVIIATDGGCRLSKEIGGWGCVLTCEDKDGNPVRKELSGGMRKTTNNVMEFTAVIEGLKALRTWNVDVTIITDSQYVVNSMTKWLEGWKKNGWRKADKSPVKNKDLIQELESLINKYKSVKFEWIKGHAGHELNERCDELAGMEMDKLEGES